MKEVCVIWMLENEVRKLVLKGLPDPDLFWVEVYSITTQALLEKSQVVNEWEDVQELLEGYHWTDYETVRIDTMFTGLIRSFRLKTGTLPKYKARERILELYDRFRNNEGLEVKRVANEYNVVEETVSRDIKLLRNFFIREKKTIVYHANQNVYKLGGIGTSDVEEEVPLQEVNSTLRILQIYDLFRTQDAVDGDEVAGNYGIGKAEFQKDLKILRTFLLREGRTIKYDGRLKNYRLIPLAVEK
ncbi:hypothetical protein [Litchfieldia alkalitelluris]|uniref:hypothetical protein n=1 Tax=Litchfieldia alkalitelluris TaxID=304268 RepID=UPI000997AD0F|nr:hypothetical protein [Litchfieldia alkalitelluris]